MRLHFFAFGLTQAQGQLPTGASEPVVLGKKYGAIMSRNRGSGDRALLQPQKTKPLVAAAVGGPAPFAAGDTRVPRIVEPATTPVDTIGA